MVLDVAASRGGVNACGSANKRDFRSRFAVGESLLAAMVAQGESRIPPANLPADVEKLSRHAALRPVGRGISRQPTRPHSAIQPLANSGNYY
jgi:hypothetical protein